MLELEGLTPSHLVSELSEMLGTAGQRYNQSVANLSSLVRDTQLSPLEVRQLERSTNLCDVSYHLEKAPMPGEDLLIVENVTILNRCFNMVHCREILNWDACPQRL